jgi:hypothetical protein
MCDKLPSDLTDGTMMRIETGFSQKQAPEVTNYFNPVPLIFLYKSKA